MTDKLQAYPEYKASGIGWFEDIPSHWQLLPLFAVLEERGETNEDGEEINVLSVMKDRGVIPYAEKGNVGNKKSEDIRRYKLVRQGDIVLNSMNIIIGSVGLSAYDGCLSPVYYVLGARSTHANTVYLSKVFQLKRFQRSLVRLGNGILAHRMRIPIGKLKRELLPIPPPNEQDAIVRFLDVAEKRIRRYIRVKQKLINLLNEQKQAIIQQAVTRGLNPDALMKDSGVKWLGEIPEHWNVAGLGLLTITRCDGPFGSGLKSTHYTDEGIRVIRLQNIGNAEFRDKSKAYISPQHYATLGNHDVLQGDVLIAGLGDGNTPAGRACVAPAGIEPAMVKADCFRFRLRTDFLVPMYVAFQLSATAFTASAILSTGATRQRINLSSASSRAIAFPSLDEQNAIVSYIFDAIAPLEETLNVIREEIKLIGEYRTRLIADVVTGKVDVRGLAFEMPEEFEDDYLLDVDEDDLLEEDEFEEVTDAE